MWLGCDRDTLYNHANNSNSPFFGTCKKLISICQVALENGAIKNKVNSVLYMFLGKNYFGLKDDKNITVSAQQGSDVNSQETAEALRKQLEEETTPNAEIISEK
jgi:glutamine amidotransferase PdxT